MLAWLTGFGLALLAGGTVLSYTYVWTRVDRPVVEAYCQGCDDVQPVRSMRFTEIGLYRCIRCRFALKVVEVHKEPKVPGMASVDRYPREVPDDRACGCCVAMRPEVELWAALPQAGTWTCQKCGCDWQPKYDRWRRMSGRYHGGGPTSNIKEIDLGGYMLPLYSPPTRNVRAFATRGVGSVCSTCEVHDNHLAYECPQRGHATVITGSGRIKEMQWVDHGSGPVAKGLFPEALRVEAGEDKPLQDLTPWLDAEMVHPSPAQAADRAAVLHMLGVR